MADPKTATPVKPTAQETAAPKKMRVLDTTAVPDVNTNPTGKRTHAQVINGTLSQFEFEPGKGLPLDEPIAVKFLRHEAFKLVDENNKIIAYQRPPKQPDELQAGEKLELAADETVARLEELTNPALLKRALAMPGGERFSAKATDRADVIRFIVQAKTIQAVANTKPETDVTREDHDNDEAMDEADAA